MLQKEVVVCHRPAVLQLYQQLQQCKLLTGLAKGCGVCKGPRLKELLLLRLVQHKLAIGTTTISA